MGKKMKLIPFFHSKQTPIPNKDPTPSLISPFQWPACGNIETLSFRAAAKGGDDIFRMVNSTYAVEEEEDYFVYNAIHSSSSCAEEAEGEGSSSYSFSTTTVSGNAAEERSPPISSPAAHVRLLEDPVEMVIKGLRSERLFFDPGESNSILGKPKSKPKGNNHASSVSAGGIVNDFNGEQSHQKIKTEVSIEEESAHPAAVPYKESVIMSLDSNDPYVDFRRSMEEMVEAHGLKDWEGLEELLSCYLKVNGKSNHGYIVGAFVDLLVNLSLASLVSSSASSSSSSLKSNKNNNNKSSSSTLTTVSVNCSSSSSSSFSIPHSSITSPPSSSPPPSLPSSPVRSTSTAATDGTTPSSLSSLLLDQVGVESSVDYAAADFGGEVDR